MMFESSAHLINFTVMAEGQNRAKRGVIMHCYHNNYSKCKYFEKCSDPRMRDDICKHTDYLEKTLICHHPIRGEGWVEATDELPGDERVMVYYKCTSEITIAWYDDEDEAWYESGVYVIRWLTSKNREILWKPMPKKPKITLT